MYTSQIITAEIKSQKGFFVGDPCYALTRSMYETLWGKMNNYRDGAFTDNFPVDSGAIGIIPLELADRKPGKGYGKFIRTPGTAKFVAEKGVFEITGPDGEVLTIDTTWD